MSTRRVRIEFYFEKGADLEYIHDIPSSLIIAKAQTAREDAGYKKHFESVMSGIMKEHEEACREASSSRCFKGRREMHAESGANGDIHHVRKIKALHQPKATIRLQHF